MPATLMPVADQAKPKTDPGRLVCPAAQELTRQLEQVKYFCFSGNLTQPTLHLVLDNCCDNWYCARSVNLTAQEGKPVVTNRPEFILGEPTECPEVQTLDDALRAVNLRNVGVFGFDGEILAFKLDCCPQAEWTLNAGCPPPECAGSIQADFTGKKAVINAYLNYSDARLTTSR